VFDQLRTNSITLCPFQDRGRSLKEGRDFWGLSKFSKWNPNNS
jgi:hypothetical protein